jgi:hypothetical protein
MGGKEDGPAFLADELYGFFYELAADHRIETGGRFVQDEQPGPVRQRQEQAEFPFSTKSPL